MTDDNNAYSAPVPSEGSKKPETRIRDLTAYAWQTLQRVNLLMNGFRRDGYIQIDLSGLVAMILPYVRIRLPSQDCAGQPRETKESAMGKNRVESKAVWLGSLTVLISFLGLIVGQEWIQQYPDVVSYIGLGIGILTVVVRHFTVKPLKPLSG